MTDAQYELIAKKTRPASTKVDSRTVGVVRPPSLAMIISYFLTVSVICISIAALVLALHDSYVRSKATETPPPPSGGDITIIHFSDFYNIEGIYNSTENITLGGLARLVTIVKQLKPDLITFGGDLFSPSAMTTIFGAPFQMIEGFNALNSMVPIVAVAGNHEFDDWMNTKKTIEKFNFPWLISNFYYYNTTTPIAGTKASHLVNIKGLNLGFIGAVFDYRTTTSLGPLGGTYEDYIIVADKMVKQYQSEDVDFIIALTHLPFNEEIHLLESVNGINLCLGGHDHFYRNVTVNGAYLIEGDTELRTASVININYVPGSKPTISKIEKIVLGPEVHKDENMTNLISRYVTAFDKISSIEIGITATTLHAKKNFIEREESNIGNFVADSILEWAIALKNSEIPIIAILNSGYLGWSEDVPQGTFLDSKIILELVPLGTPTVQQINGSVLRSVLENSVSQLPNASGRFLQISGFNYTHLCNTSSCRANPGSRVVNITFPDGKPITPGTILNLVTTDYVSAGHEGYDMLISIPFLLSSEVTPLLFSIVLENIEKFAVISPTEEGRIIQG